MPHSKLPEFEIGELLNLPPGFSDRIASVAYDPRYPIAMIHSQASTAPASQMLEALTLQLLRLHVENGVKLALFEPLPSAQFGLLKRLFARTGQAYGKQLVGDAAYHTHIQSLTELAHKRFALLANLDVANLAEYNAHPRVRRKEPWQLLLVSAVLPQSGRDGDLAALETLCREGAKVGILPLLLRGPAEAMEQENSYTRKSLQAFWRAVAPLCFGFDWNNQPPTPVNQLDVYWRSLNRFGVRVGVPAQRTQQWVGDLCAAQVQTEKEAEYPDFLSVPIGVKDNETIHFALGHATNAFNALVSGGAGSGKTTFLQNLILSICENYTPEQIQLVLLDYGTVSFGPYRRVAHVQSVLDDPNDGMQLYQMLDFLTQELHRRKNTFKSCGLQHNLTVDNLRTYKKLTGVALPSIILVIDEFGSLMDNKNMTSAQLGNRVVRISVQAEETINFLIREGRKVGLHIILITQSFAKVDRMPQDFKSNPHVALGLKAENVRDSRALLNSENDAAHYLEKRQAVLNVHAGQAHGNLIVDLEHITEDSIAHRQQTIRKKWPKMQDSPLEQHLQKKPPPSSSGSNEQPSWMR